MGQCLCCGRLKGHVHRGSQYRHKRFEFNPARSWKFKDSAIRTEFQELSVRNDDAVDENLDSPTSGTTPTVVNGERRRGSDEEDGGLGEVRRGGRLVFSDDPDDNSNQVSVEPSEVTMEIEETRARSWSNSSEKMGRFEVWTLDEGALMDPPEDKDGERSRLIPDNDS